MIDLLIKFRDVSFIIIIFIAVLLIIIEHDRVKMAENKVDSLNSIIAEQNIAILEWKTQGEDLERKLRLTEQEASVRARKSQKRVNTILSAQVPKDCEAAILWGLHQIHDK